MQRQQPLFDALRNPGEALQVLQRHEYGGLFAGTLTLGGGGVSSWQSSRLRTIEPRFTGAVAAGLLAWFLLSLADLHDLLGVSAGEIGPDDEQLVVVMRVASATFGLIVQGVEDVQEIVVKPLGSPLAHLKVYSGQTILGDGSVVLILDSGGIAETLGIERTAAYRDARADVGHTPRQSRTRVVLLRAGDGARKALPLSLITRIESVDTAAVEQTGAGYVLRHRGQLMPLLPAADGVAPTHANQPVLVIGYGGETMGLLVDEIIDIVEDPLEIQIAQGAPGVIGTAEFGGVVAELLDLTHFIRIARPDSASRGVNRKFKVALVDDRQFFRDMLTPVLSAAGYHVTTLASATDALAMIDKGAQFDAIVTDIDMPDIDGYRFARDLRAMAALQQRLVAAQQSLERDYARMRSVETRYRLLFQVSAEPVLIVEAASGKIVEANPATAQLLAEPAKRIVGRSLYDSFEPAAAQDIRALLAAVQTTGRPDNAKVRLQQRRELLVHAALFRQEALSFFLIRLLPLDGEPGGVAVATVKARLLEAVQSAPDAFVVTDPEGRILTANAAFLDLAQLATEEQARGESLERWLGRPGVDLNVLIANLRQHGSVRLFLTTLRGEYGATAEIEASAVAVPSEEQPCFGFTIRSIGRRLPAEPRGGRELPRSMEQLAELVGRVPLKDLVRDTTDVIERMCIEAALELTGDNRASAAEILGLSRQSLYVKLHRYGLGDLAGDSESD